MQRCRPGFRICLFTCTAHKLSLLVALGFCSVPQRFKACPAYLQIRASKPYISSSGWPSRFSCALLVWWLTAWRMKDTSAKWCYLTTLAHASPPIEYYDSFTHMSWDVRSLDLLSALHLSEWLMAAELWSTSLHSTLFTSFLFQERLHMPFPFNSVLVFACIFIFQEQ